MKHIKRNTAITSNIVMELLHNVPQTCRGCKSSKLIDDIADGSVVCTSCGLVASSFLIDDRPIFDNCRNIHSGEVPWYKRSTDRDPELVSLLDKMDIECEGLEAFATKIIKDWKEINEYKGHMAPLRAYAIYQACRSFKLMTLDKIKICLICDVDQRQLQQFQTTGTHVVDTSINDRIKQLASCFIIDPKTRMTAIRHATAIETRLQTNVKYMSKKPSKMDAVILYHVCSTVLNIKFKKGDYVRDCDLSSATFNKHLKFLQGLL